MKKKLFLITILFMSACVPHPGGKATLPDDQLNAENRLMKNNLNLALRENEVVKEENKQYKAKTAKLTEEIQRLNEKITDLNRKYAIDMAAMTERYNMLSDQYDFLQTSSSDRILELIATNLELDRQMKNEISRLNSEMGAQKTSFEKARQSLEKAFSEREKEFEAEISAMEQTLADRETAIASMKAANDAAQLRIDTLQEEIDSNKATLGRMSQENNGLTQSNQSPETNAAAPEASDGIIKNRPSLPVSDPSKTEAGESISPPAP